jgi:hypothetical protein
MSIISLSQNIIVGNLSLSLSDEEIAILQLISSKNEKVLECWNNLWSNVHDYEEFSFSCKELMPSAVKKIQDSVAQNAWQQHTVGNADFLVGLPRYTWTKNQYIINQYKIIAAALEKENIELISIKGVCEILAGSNLAMMRTSRDIDILIHHEDWVKCKKIFTDLGWTMDDTPNQFQGMRSPLTTHAETFYNKERIMDLDVHFSAISGLKKYSKNFTEELWKKKVSATKYPNLFIPSKEDRLIITAANAYNMQNWERGHVCKYIYDAISISNTMDNDEIEKALLRGEQYLKIGNKMGQLINAIKELADSNNMNSEDRRKYVLNLSITPSVVNYLILLKTYQQLIIALFTGSKKLKTLIFISTLVLHIVFISIPKKIIKLFKRKQVQHTGGVNPKDQLSWYLYSTPLR